MVINHKMNKETLRKQILIKYQDHLRTASGGVFTPKERRRLLGLERAYGGRTPHITLATFWNRINEDVSNALVDLGLFVEAAPSEKVNKVITSDSVCPIINDYFQLEFGSYAEQSVVKAKIARDMISAGFNYLTATQYQNVADYQRKIIVDALDVSKDLAERMTLNVIRNEQEVSK